MKVYDVAVEPDGYSFRVAAADEARLSALLRRVLSAPDAKWQADTGRWWVAPGYEAVLGRLLDNFTDGLALATAPADESRSSV